MQKKEVLRRVVALGRCTSKKTYEVFLLILSIYSDNILFVYSESLFAGGQVGYDLTGGGDSGVDVGFGCLRSHFFRGEEYAVAEAFFHFCGAFGGYVGCIFEVRALVKCSNQSVFVDHFFAGGVDEESSLGHGYYEVVADRVAGFGSGGNVDRDYFVVAVEFVDAVDGGDSGCGDDFVGAIGVDGGDVHAESAGDACYVAADLSECLNAEGFVFEFGT